MCATTYAKDYTKKVWRFYGGESRFVDAWFSSIIRSVRRTQFSLLCWCAQANSEMYVSSFRERVTLPLLLFALGSLLFVFGCRAAPELPAAPSTPASTTTGSTTTLTIWHTFTDQRRNTFETLAQNFHQVYPDLVINPVYVGSRDDLTKQMNAAVALGSAPDLVLADRRQIAEFAAQGGLLPLDKFINDADLGFAKEDKSDFLGGALQLGQFPTLGNRSYGMPFDQEAFVLFYNADLLKTINVNRAPRTWEQFAQYATTVTKDPVYGWAMRANADTLEAMLVSRGSALLTDAETRALFNERAGLASLQMVADLNEGGVAKLAASDEKAQREFASGNAAFYLGWLSELEALQAMQKEAKTDFEIGVAPLPQLDPQTPWLLTRGNLFGIPIAPQGRTDGERARNAWFFVRWITAPTQSAQWVRATNAIPLRASTLQFIAPDLAKNPRFRQIATAFDGVLPDLAPQPAHSYMDRIEEMVAGLWLQAVEPKANLPALLDDAAQRVNQVLAVQP
jgi:sn-glycerol 3-phosphate transport system substrate-binding protein